MAESAGDGHGGTRPGAASDRLATARRAVNRERRRCTDEREALRSFSREMADLTPTRASVPQMQARFVGTSTRDDEPMETVRDVYERTVMAVPHYESDYDEPFERSLAAEFGEDVAAAVHGAETLTPELKRALVAAAESARDERESFIRLLDRESESLAVRQEELGELLDDLEALDSTPLSERGFDELSELWTALTHLEERADRIAERRQETLSRHRHTLSGLDADVTDYLYADLEATYPVLETVADFGVVLERARGRVGRALTTTV